MVSPSVSPDDRLVQRSDVETRPYDKGAMLVDMGSGQCYRLNRVGADVWALLKQPVALADVIATLGARYEISRATLEQDVRALVEHLLAQALVRALPADASP
jgi:hypothetical protein